MLHIETRGTAATPALNARRKAVSNDPASDLSHHQTHTSIVPSPSHGGDSNYIHDGCTDGQPSSSLHDSCSSAPAPPISPTSPMRDPHHKRRPKRISATFGGPGSLNGSRSGSGSSYSTMTASTPSCTNSPLSPLFISFTHSLPDYTHSPTTVLPPVSERDHPLRQQSTTPQHPFELSPAISGVSDTEIRSGVTRVPLISGTFGLDVNGSPASVLEDETETSNASIYRAKDQDDRATTCSARTETSSDGGQARARFTFGYDDTLKEEDVLKILPPASPTSDNNIPIQATTSIPLPFSSTVHSPRIHSTPRTSPSNLAAADQPPPLSLPPSSQLASSVDHSYHGTTTNTNQQPHRRNSSVSDQDTLISSQLQGQQQQTPRRNLRLRSKQRLSFFANMFMSTLSPSPSPSPSPFSSSFATSQQQTSTATTSAMIEKPLPPVPEADIPSFEGNPSTAIPMFEIPKKLTTMPTSSTAMAPTDMYESDGAHSSHDSVAADTFSRVAPQQPTAMSSRTLTNITNHNRSTTTLPLADSGFLASVPTKSKRIMFGASPSTTSLSSPQPQFSPARVKPPPLQLQPQQGHTLPASSMYSHPDHLRQPDPRYYSHRNSITSVILPDNMATSPAFLGLNRGSVSSGSSTHPGGTPYLSASQESLVVSSLPSPTSLPLSLPLSPLKETNGSEYTLSSPDPNDYTQRPNANPRRQHQGLRPQQPNHNQHYNQSKLQYQSPPSPDQDLHGHHYIASATAMAPAAPIATASAHSPRKETLPQNQLVSPSVLSLSAPPRSSSLNPKNFVDGENHEDKTDKPTKTKKRKRGISLSLFCMCLKK
ncbi:MAG: hypothetical protein J3Q66DRAFT_367638 [Benniella sp.]|nr:MAG: hypothetical protein J3Q66DRAFT_367638 [Benniella sp.]